MPEVVVYLLEGRSLEQKRGLVKYIAQAAVKNAGTTPLRSRCRWSRRLEPPRPKVVSSLAKWRAVK